MSHPNSFASTMHSHLRNLDQPTEPKCCTFNDFNDLHEITRQHRIYMPSAFRAYIIWYLWEWIIFLALEIYLSWYCLLCCSVCSIDKWILKINKIKSSSSTKFVDTDIHRLITLIKMIAPSRHDPRDSWSWTMEIKKVIISGLGHILLQKAQFLNLG